MLWKEEKLTRVYVKGTSPCRRASITHLGAWSLFCEGMKIVNIDKSTILQLPSM